MMYVYECIYYDLISIYDTFANEKNENYELHDDMLKASKLPLILTVLLEKLIDFSFMVSRSNSNIPG